MVVSNVLFFSFFEIVSDFFLIEDHRWMKFDIFSRWNSFCLFTILTVKNSTEESSKKQVKRETIKNRQVENNLSLLLNNNKKSREDDATGRIETKSKSVRRWRLPESD
jgi:hypothetical protein